MDAYEILGLPRSASEEDIKKRYRALVKEFHPDLHPDDPTAARHMSEINAAYEAVRSGKAADIPVGHYRDGSMNGAPAGTWTDEKGTHYYAYEDISDLIREMFGMKGSGAIGDYEFVEMYISNGAYQRAAKMLDNMSRSDPRWYYYAAQIYEHTGDMDKAENYARAAMHMSGDERYVSYWQSLIMQMEEERLNKENESVIAKNLPRIIALILAVIFSLMLLRSLFGIFVPTRDNLVTSSVSRHIFALK
ncbi:MAG: DnaJ domain-containing protein [Oscillospiraceae bacterium]|nr:DnaJ domain-containing protein [Oscillospiraceae bacterium]